MAATLYINFQRVDLSKREQVALSYAVNRLTDIQSRQGFYSNTFKLPDNARNREVFGWPHEINSTDTRRFTRLPAHIEADGVTVMQGFAELRTAGGDIEAVVKAGNADWIADMKGKTIRDLDLSDLDHFPDEATVAANRFNTSSDGFIYPDADYGNLRQLIEPLIPCWYLAPALFLKEVVARAFAQHGWTLVNELDGLPTYENTVLPYVDHNLPHTDEWVESKKFRANMEGDNLFAGPTSNEVFFMGFDTVDFDNGSQFTVGSWDGTSAQAFYVPNEEIRQEFKLTCTIDVTQRFIDGFIVVSFLKANYPASFYQSINELGSGFGGAGGVFEFGDGSQMFIVKHPMPNGIHEFTISTGLINAMDFQGVRVAMKGATVDFLSGQLWNEPATQRLPRSYFSMARHAPDIKLTEVIKYMVNSYSAIIDADGVGKVVRIRRFDTIRTNAPVDWSEKIDLTDKPEHSFDFGGFQRVNVLEYDNDTDDRALVNDADLGRFEIASPHVDRGQSILYTAPLSLSQRTGAFAGQRELAVIDQFSAETKGVRVNAFELTVTAINNSDRRITVTGNATRLRSGDKVTFYGFNFLDQQLVDGVQRLNWNTLTVDEVESFTQFTVTNTLTSGTANDGFAYCGAFGNFIKTGEMDAFAVGDQITLSGISSGAVHGLPVNIRPFTVTGISGETLIIDEPILTTTPHVGVAGTLINTIREPYKPRKTTPRVARVQTVAGNEVQLLGTATVTDSSTLWHQYLHWEELAGDHWHTLTGIIADPQQVKVLMRLTASDINQLDFARPVWVEWFAAYFFLSFVNQFRADVVDSTEVELVKLPMP